MTACSRDRRPRSARIGAKPGSGSALLEQEKRGPATRGGVSVAGEPAGEMMFPLVRELADDGLPVTVTCGTLDLCRQQYYRWLECPVSDAKLDEAWLANAIFDAPRDDPEFGYRRRAAGFEVSDRVVWQLCRDMAWWSVFGKPTARKASKPGTPAHDDFVRRQSTPTRRTRSGSPIWSHEAPTDRTVVK
jgi:hypothetical protein